MGLRVQVGRRARGRLGARRRAGPDLAQGHRHHRPLPGGGAAARGAGRARRRRRRRDRGDGRPRPARLRRAAEPDAPHRPGGAADGRRPSRSPTSCSTCSSWDGEDLLALPYAERRARLDALGSPGTAGWRPRGSRRRRRRAGRQRGERARRASSPSGWTPRTGPGLRSPDWRKIKNFRTQAVVVGGWRPGQGRRTGTIGSLLVGVPDDEGRLVYVGPRRHRVQRPGPARPAADVHRRAGRRRSRAPCRARSPATRTGSSPTWSGEVAYAVWTADNRLRHPAWRGVRRRPRTRRRGGRAVSGPGEAAGGDRRADARASPTWRRCCSRRSASPRRR